MMLAVLLLTSVFAFSQVMTDSILVEGHYRNFRFNKPLATGKNPALFFILHGSGGSAEGMMKNTTRIESIAAKENVVIVYPEGFHHFWNECRKASNAEANLQNINENEFFSQMINYFSDRYKIDSGKVFVAGFSGGGHMAYKLALTMPDKVSAITAIVANQPEPAWSDCTEARIARPVLIINGTKDATNPYEGGEMFVNNASFGVVNSTESTFRYWAGLAGYTGEPQKKLLPDTDPADNKTIEAYTFQAKGKPEITLLKVIGGHHDYPNDIDVYVYAWEFFKRQK
jgi:polyhydroxybutyrate depolymerase